MATSTPYASTAELNTQTGIDLSKYSSQVSALLLTASKAIDLACNRPDGFVADGSVTSRTFVGSGTNVQKIDECVEITSVKVKKSVTDTTYETWESTDWIAFTGSNKRPNFNPLVKDQPKPYTKLMIAITGNHSHFTSGLTTTAREGFSPISTFLEIGQPTVYVTAKWGYAVSVPDVIKQATLIQAARWFKRGQGQWADEISNADFGEIRVVKENDPVYHYLLKNKMIRPAIG